MTNETPNILVDAAEEGFCEEQGWVEAIVSRERACELIWPHAEMHPDGIPPDPERVTKVTLVPNRDPATANWEDIRWHPVGDLRKIAAEQTADEPEVDDLEARLLEARDYWQVPVA